MTEQGTARADAPGLCAEIDRLRAENTRLREALDPFAAQGRSYPADLPNDMRVSATITLCDLTVGHCRRARAVREGCE